MIDFLQKCFGRKKIIEDQKLSYERVYVQQPMDCTIGEEERWKYTCRFCGDRHNNYDRAAQLCMVGLQGGLPMLVNTLYEGEEWKDPLSGVIVKKNYKTWYWPPRFDF